jgi:adenylosuccinate synthase
MGNLVVLGAQWGDEGKGKIVDLFSSGFDIVARYQGGHNAGHTVRIGDKKFILKLIPSGILRPRVKAVIGNGLVVDPAALVAEMDSLRAAGVDVDKQLAISSRAHVIFPFHRMVEKISEARADRVAIGTTSRGIGPCYEDKTGRRGIRMADFIDSQRFSQQFDALAEDKRILSAAFKLQEPLDLYGIKREYAKLAERLAPMVCDTTLLLNRAICDGKRVLFEGAQGTMLDVDHGTYPFVTSSSATAGGVSVGTGVPPSKIGSVVGVVKAYVTRVGAGPFPTELTDATGEMLRSTGHEFGAVTGRPRRCGWFDVPLMRYTSMINGFNSLAMTKLDVLDQIESIKVCVAYRLGGKLLESVPATAWELQEVEPVYETLPGWMSATAGLTEYDKLPQRARQYVEFLEGSCGVEVGCVSTGPEREQTILKSGSSLERALR